MQPLTAQPQVKPGGKEGVKPSSGERVEVSNTSKLLAEARGPNEPDMARVQRLKDAITNGEFTIDAERIASAMLHEEL
jgi:flagellar biosynthesis anti-sigma factor FlgM